MSWKPAWKIVNDDDIWRTNAQAFETKDEAEASARTRFEAWTATTAWTALWSDEPVNYARVDGRDRMINREEPKS
jgi:hypothetical protein